MKKILQVPILPCIALLIFFNLSFPSLSFAQPANDQFTSATALASNTTCVTTAGTLQSATVSSPAVPTTCGTPGGDVWYQFVAQSTDPTIALSTLGINFGPVAGNPRIQIFSGSFGALTSLGCVSAASLTVTAVYPTGLTPGNIYFISKRAVRR